ncbi:hypothetical protein [Hansschlegelia sp. KR7-227]|jgi:hypothetical protein|uniref:hypothetical protein n=1 Tax=Hansschlegelia sp. KR7-227 TaxID=3400914 RepID=UPI003BFB4478
MTEMFALFDLWRRQAALAGGMAAMGPAVGYVVAARLSRMTVEAGLPTSAGLLEAERMVTEKLAAGVEGGMAAGRVLTRLNAAAGPVAAAGVMVAAGEAALRPVSRTVRANARRLSRRG